MTALLMGAPASSAAGEAEEMTIVQPLTVQTAREGTEDYVNQLIRDRVAADEAEGKYLSQGLSLVFLLEGAGRNDDPEQRQFALCVVIRHNEAGEPEIVYENDFCTTIPDHPLGTYDTVDCATAMDGEYDLYTDNRIDSGVLSLERRGKIKVLRFNSFTIRGHRGYLDDATDIQLHMRKEEGNTVPNTTKPFSRGCMMIGLGAWEFNEFMNSVINFHEYVNGDPYRYFDTGVDRDVLMGRLILDRTLAADYLTEIYGVKGALHIRNLYTEEE